MLHHCTVEYRTDKIQTFYSFPTKFFFHFTSLIYWKSVMTSRKSKKSVFPSYNCSPEKQQRCLNDSNVNPKKLWTHLFSCSPPICVLIAYHLTKSGLLPEIPPLISVLSRTTNQVDQHALTYFILTSKIFPELPRNVC